MKAYCHLVFPLLMLLKCPPNMCSTLNPLDQLHKKWILRNVLKTSFESCSLNSASPYTLKYLNNGCLNRNDNNDSKCEIFYRRPNSSKHVSNFTTKTMRHIRHPPCTKNETLSYPHKIDWRRLTNVWYGSFRGSETLEIYIYSSLTVWRQSIDRQ